MPEEGIVKVTRSVLRRLADRAGLDVEFHDDETATLRDRARLEPSRPDPGLTEKAPKRKKRHPAPERAVVEPPEAR